MGRARTASSSPAGPSAAARVAKRLDEKIAERAALMKQLEVLRREDPSLPDPAGDDVQLAMLRERLRAAKTTAARLAELARTSSSLSHELRGRQMREVRDEFEHLTKTIHRIEAARSA